MSCRSRFGGFRKGKKLFKDKWDSVKEDDDPEDEDEVPLVFPTDIGDFQYIHGKGIWDLTATNQFPKAQAPVYSLGLTSSLLSLSGQNSSWTQRTVDLSPYVGATCRVVFKYSNGGSFRGDLQLDSINLDGNTYTFESSTENFQTSTVNTSAYSSVSWSSLSTGTSAARWNRDSGNTPSSNTGNLGAYEGSFFVYAETSSPADNSGYNFWLRGPQVTLSTSPSLSFSEGRQGSDIGSLDVYLDIIA